jgi:uncharacterized protein YdhG (YjbR/CyaY superfamily)
MPAFRHKGPLVYFAAFRDHLSFFVGDKAVLRTFRRELAPFHASVGTLHFTPKRPIPASLVRRIVKARVKQNEDRAAARRRD